MTRAAAILGLVLASGSLRAGDLNSSVKRPIDFDRDVRTILSKHCYACHGPGKQKGGLRLDLNSAALKGGDSGAAIVPGKSGESLIVRLTSGQEEDRVMPPKGERLSAQQIAILRDWIDRGASWPGSSGDSDGRDWWSLRPLKRPAVPVLDPGDRIRSHNPIDAFILAKLREQGLAPSPDADRRILARRLYFDLTGLPPTPEQVEEFLSDHALDAYERLVDRLLSSPHLGERWARHWLDVVHYGDTHGYDKDQPRPNAWPYRDYVIRAFNADTPYGRFVREQLAGDILYPDSADGVIALGFIAAGPWDLIGHAEVPESKIDGKVARHLDRDDMVSNTINTFLSLTVQCAQCHNHKFDPIPQEEYYRLQAVFAALDRADRPYYADATAARRAAELSAARDALIGPRLQVLLMGITARLSGLALVEIDARLARLQAELARVSPHGLVYAGTIHNGGTSPFRGTGHDGGKPRSIHLLRRGDVTNPGPAVDPGALNILAELPGTLELSAGHVEGDRRAALARWLTAARNALLWRSIVNRVWQYHFGRGIVATANDFGRMGELPTHPELLDWLAVEFRDGGQSLKTLHRLIVTSATYRQTSVGNSAAEVVDANNSYLWRMNRRKLEGEAVRDAALAAAGKLSQAMYGSAFRDFVVEHPEHSPHYEYDLHQPDDPATFRRAVYRFLVRSKPQPFMSVLDCADPSMQVERRNETVSPLQALALYNNGFMLVMARHLALRVAKEGPPSVQVVSAFRLAVGRPPSSQERESLATYAERYGLPSACRLILNLNEFVFVD
jgi:hypothetical protein